MNHVFVGSGPRILCYESGSFQAQGYMEDHTKDVNVLVSLGDEIWSASKDKLVKVWNPKEVCSPFPPPPPFLLSFPAPPSSLLPISTKLFLTLVFTFNKNRMEAIALLLWKGMEAKYWVCVVMKAGTYGAAVGTRRYSFGTQG